MPRTPPRSPEVLTSPSLRLRQLREPQELSCTAPLQELLHVGQGMEKMSSGGSRAILPRGKGTGGSVLRSSPQHGEVRPARVVQLEKTLHTPTSYTWLPMGRARPRATLKNPQTCSQIKRALTLCHWGKAQERQPPPSSVHSCTAHPHGQ